MTEKNVKQALQTIEDAKAVMSVSMQDFLDNYYHARKYLDELSYTFDLDNILLAWEIEGEERITLAQVREIKRTFSDAETFRKFIKYQKRVRPQDCEGFINAIFS